MLLTVFPKNLSVHVVYLWGGVHECRNLQSLEVSDPFGWSCRQMRATQHGCLLWDFILTKQKCVTFANTAEYYFNCVTVCYFSLGAAFV